MLIKHAGLVGNNCPFEGQISRCFFSAQIFNEFAFLDSNCLQNESKSCFLF